MKRQSGDTIMKQLKNAQLSDEREEGREEVTESDKDNLERPVKLADNALHEFVAKNILVDHIMKSFDHVLKKRKKERKKKASITNTLQEGRKAYLDDIRNQIHDVVGYFLHNGCQNGKLVVGNLDRRGKLLDDRSDHLRGHVRRLRYDA